MVAFEAMKHLSEQQKKTMFYSIIFFVSQIKRKYLFDTVNLLLLHLALIQSPVKTTNKLIKL